ncbi:MAG: hypothetical protein JNM57_10365 [Cyclobacteriaceae bacterium]|nr:hypothetical protein [Cyclobacteriaceae bacterium]
MLRSVKALYWFVLKLVYRLKILSVHNIPVIINNFNRLTYPLQLISFLEKCGFRNIIILDNNSTYPPLLEYYKSCKHKVFQEQRNYGHLALWESGIYNRYKWNYFIYTDADVVPSEACPVTFIEHFKNILDADYYLDKVGFSIRIDDLPDSFALKAKIIEYEKNYWSKEYCPGVYKAPIDTTFALYKPFSSLKAGEIYTLEAVRVGFPYTIRHMPWYVDSKHLQAEELYYLERANASSSVAKQNSGSEAVY